MGPLRWFQATPRPDIDSPIEMTPDQIQTLADSLTPRIWLFGRPGHTAQMAFYVLAGLLFALLITDWTITLSSRRRKSWAFWEDWSFYVYGPPFVLVCLGLSAERRIGE